MNSKSSEKIIISIFIVLGLILSVVGISFAFFAYSKEGKVENTIHSGTLILNFNEHTNGIRLQNAFPISDTDALSAIDVNSYFDFSVDYTIVGQTSLTYEVDIVDITDNSLIQSGITKLDSKNLKIALLDNSTKNTILGPSYFSDVKKVVSGNGKEGYKLYEKVVTTTGSDQYRLYMWIPEIDASGNKVSMIDIFSQTEKNEDGSFVLLQKGISNQTFSVKINIQALDTASLVNNNK